MPSDWALRIRLYFFANVRTGRKRLAVLDHDHSDANGQFLPVTSDCFTASLFVLVSVEA